MMADKQLAETGADKQPNVRCRVCDGLKFASDYYPKQIKMCGTSGECKECTKIRVRRNRRAKVDYYRDYDKQRFQNDPRVKQRHAAYQRTDAGKQSLIRSRKKWLANNSEKRAAHVLVGNSIRTGRLSKPTSCEKCGKSEGRIHGHHEDYSKPLDVIWLCPKCHTAAHKEDQPYA